MHQHVLESLLDGCCAFVLRFGYELREGHVLQRCGGQVGLKGFEVLGSRSSDDLHVGCKGCSMFVHENSCAPEYCEFTHSVGENCSELRLVPSGHRIRPVSGLVRGQMIFQFFSIHEMAE